MFGVAEGQLGIRKQQFPWSDVNLAQHADFINHLVSSVNLIGRQGCLSLAHFPPINITAMSTHMTRHTLTRLCLDRQRRVLPFPRTPPELGINMLLVNGTSVYINHTGKINIVLKYFQWRHLTGLVRYRSYHISFFPVYFEVVRATEKCE